MGAVICYWEDYIDVVGPTKDTVRYPLEVFPVSLLKDQINMHVFHLAYRVSALGDERLF